jgi:hypothetical protein
MQSTLLEAEKPTALNATNTAHLQAAEDALARGDLAVACEELRQLPRRVAGNPVVINFRRRLVTALLGLEDN